MYISELSGNSIKKVTGINDIISSTVSYFTGAVLDFAGPNINTTKPKDGTALDIYGKSSAAGKFEGPCGIAVNSSNVVFVCDTNSNNIRIIQSSILNDIPFNYIKI